MHTLVLPGLQGEWKSQHGGWASGAGMVKGWVQRHSAPATRVSPWRLGQELPDFTVFQGKVVKSLDF